MPGKDDVNIREVDTNQWAAYKQKQKKTNTNT
jgi:hypothetical protein